MNTQLLETKFHVPAWRADGVARPRLLDQLHGGLCKRHKLTLISAPAGYGKTTLIAEWIAMPPPALPLHKIAWLTLDEADNEPTRFLRYWLAALRRVDDALGQNVQYLLGMGQIPTPAAILSELINDLAALPYALVLVMDDYHVIATPAIHKLIEFLLDHQPPNLHLIVSTRQDPPFALAQLRVRATVTEIRADDLRFTIKEAMQFFAHTMKLVVDAAAVRLLEARTEGWIAGLQLAALSLQGEHEVTAFAHQFGGTHRYVIDYLVEQVLQKQHRHIRAFLVRTSILDRMCAALCEALAPDDSNPGAAAAYLNYLEQANLFLIPLDHERRWYRYHQLFADSLRAELDTAEQARLHRRAAQWFAAQDLMGEAIEHAYRARDFALAAQLIEHYGPVILRRGEVATLVEWLSLLPQEILQANPKLITSKAYTLFFTGQTAAALALIEATLGDDQLGDPVSRGRLLALRAWFPALARDVKTDELARTALTLIEPDDALARSFALIPLGHAQRANGDLLGSTATFRLAYRLSHQADFPLALMGVLYNLAFNLHELGRRREGLALCEGALARFVDARGKPLPLVGIVYVPLAVLHYAANELALAREYAQKGLELSRQSISGMILGGDAEYILAQVHLIYGDTAAALTLLRTTQAVARREGMLHAADNLWVSEVDLALRMGEIAPALYWAKALGFTPEGIGMATSGKYPLIYARLLLAQGQWRDAQVVLTRFAEHARTHSRHLWSIMAAILLAQLARERGDLAAAIEHLAQAVQLAAPENYCRLLLDHAQPLADLLPRVRQVDPHFVDQLIADLGVSTPMTPRAHCAQEQSLVEPLSDREIEILRLIGTGLSNQEIAHRLVITVGTTKWHLNHIYAKLGVKGRTSAIARAQALKLL